MTYNTHKLLRVHDFVMKIDSCSQCGAAVVIDGSRMLKIMVPNVKTADSPLASYIDMYFGLVSTAQIDDYYSEHTPYHTMKCTLPHTCTPWP